MMPGNLNKLLIPAYEIINGFMPIIENDESIIVKFVISLDSFAPAPHFYR